VTEWLDGKGQVQFEDNNDQAADLDLRGKKVVNASNVGGGGVSVSDNASVVVSEASDINFGSDLTVTDDGDNTVTIDVNTTTDTRTDVSEDGTGVVTSVLDINFSSNMTVTDDGDGSVTVSSTDTSTNISDNGTQVLTDTTDINFSTNLDAVDDGDGSVTVSSTDTSTNISDNGTQVLADTTDINFSDNLDVVDDGDGSVTVTGSASGGEKVAMDTQMSLFEAGLTNQEIYRIVLQSGETLAISRIEARQKGGGSDPDFTVRVRDTTAATTIGSQDLGGTTKNPGSSGTGNTVTVEVSNSTGSSVPANIRVHGLIEGA